MIRSLGLAVLVATLSAGACSKETSYTVASHKLVVKDSGYVTTTDRYCSAAAPGQLLLTIVDYDPICGAMIPATADGGARDPQLEHNELELLFVTSAQTDPKLPYEVNVPDCTLGPAGPGAATFRHYPSGSTTPQVTQATSGEIYLTSYDPGDLKPAVGSFKLDFGIAGKIEGEFETYTCN